jgi:hypothetical protein
METSMKTVSKFVALTLMLLAVSVCGFSQSSAEKPTTTTQNLVRGVIGPLSSSNAWANYTILSLIPGSALFPITSSTTVFYFGFTAGSEADISNMVLYTTARGGQTITAVTPVTLGGISNPSISLASTAVCPVQPLSATSPCIVRFDPLTLTLSPASDYYLAVYFSTNSNNSAIGGAVSPLGSAESSLAGWYEVGDYSHVTVGQPLPIGSRNQPIFLMYVMNS